MLYFFQKCEGVLQPEYRKFSVDPQITSFEVLQSILAKAFDIRGDFTVCYRAFDDYGQETYLSLLSDWDLDAAFLSNVIVHCVGTMPVPAGGHEAVRGELRRLGRAGLHRRAAHAGAGEQAAEPAAGLILNQVERTFSMVQRALNLVEEQQPPVSDQPPRCPLTDAEFRKFLGPVGQVVQARELRTVIYYGGIEPSLRKVVWKHILNVYPDGMSGKERMDYMKKKAYEYQALRDCWKEMVKNGQVTGDLAYVTSMVRKDVLRTDRHHKFYAGSDDNQNIASLFNILTTYALNHPTVSYCQGMSDLASPLLVTMGDEAHAYICFCALMKRLHTNFLLDGIVMTLKFQHLAEGLLYYDPEFYAYLKSHQADDLLFCYRWLLLEMKREFAFDDALRMLEVLWSSLPPMPPQKELFLFETKFCTLTPGDEPAALSPLLKTPRENAYTKVCALRRQSSAASLHSLSTSNSTRQVIRHRQNQSLDETSTVKERSKVKPFASLDDASLQMIGRAQESKTQSVTSFDTLSEPESDETTIINHINSNTVLKSEVNSDTSANLLISKGGSKRGYLQDLKEKFSGSQGKNFFSSLDKNDTQDVITDDTAEKKQVRVVKNLNEFLNFTALNKNRLIPDKIVPNQTPKKDSSNMWQENSSITVCEKTCLADTDPPVTSPKDAEISEDKDKVSTEGQFGNRDAFCDGSSPDDSTEYFPMTTSMTRELRLELENLDRQVFGSKFNQHNFTLEDSEELESPCSESFHSVEFKADGDGENKDCAVSKHDSDIHSETTVVEVAEICPEPSPKPLTLKLDQNWQQSQNQTPKHSDSDKKARSSLRLNQALQHFSPSATLGTGEEIFVWENPLQCPTTPDEQADLEYDDSHSESGFNIAGGEIFENEGQGIKSVTPIRLLRSGVGVQDQHSNNKTSQRDDASDSSDGWDDHRGNICNDTRTVPNRAVLPEKRGSDPGQVARQKAKEMLPAAPPTAMTNSCEEVTEHTLRNSAPAAAGTRQTVQCTGTQLPPPSEFGGGNPFLMFLCLTVLSQHRDKVMGNSMDYNEMAMHFDKMIRKHNVTRVLNQARQMFAAYLRQQASLNNNTVNSNSDLNV
ncbi:hypothetical protein ANN_16513 [Periplaneta americana]|uniref:Rab-GAP TBC domain-containing protein n=1 Tax=Periplaneta americana TaxID=6978 RepID=A0ABQ8SQL7_PERAM|nr:hypothetical protein ANN_16513 [Periplaneta americana]